MAGYAVAYVDEIDELVDGRCLYRPVRLHFGITSFGGRDDDHADRRHAGKGV
jgi:hypothetical protein